jgi:hypothetical protein
VENHKCKRPLVRLRRRWEDNIKVDIQEIRLGRGVGWRDLDQDRDTQRVVVNAAMNIRAP